MTDKPTQPTPTCPHCGSRNLVRLTSNTVKCQACGKTSQSK